MDIKPPSQDQVDALFLALSHRYPEKAFIDVPGDGGATVRLPLILGNPSGACALPKGTPALPAWGQSVAITLKLKPDDDGLTEQLVQDCILWPDLATWNAWVNRWPAIPSQVLRAIRKKYAGTMEVITDPVTGAERSDSVTDALAAHPHAVWKKLKIRGHEMDAVINPPQGAAWRAFTDMVTKKGSDPWALAVEMTRASIVLCEPIKLDEVISRWCGVPLIVLVTIAELIGAASEVELSGW